MVSKYTDPKTKQPYRGVCAQEYQDILRDALLPQAASIFAKGSTRWATKWTWQQDNASSHVAASTIRLLAASCPKFIADWPPHSPDLSYIENMWSLLKRKVASREPYASFAACKAAVQEEWDAIDVNVLQNCCDGVADRLERCIELDGESIS